jgi:predicted nucleic acid-binding protein
LIFVDSKVPMYLVGAAHPNKLAAQRMLERCLGERIPMVTDAEVLQEILHRYTTIRRRDAIQPAFDVLLGIVDDAWAVDRGAAERAKAIVLEREPLSARDALHVSLMEHHGVTRIASPSPGGACCSAQGSRCSLAGTGRARCG